MTIDFPDRLWESENLHIHKNVTMTDEKTKNTILVVDDTPENIDILVGVLGSRYRIKAALDGKKALKIASITPAPDLILLDVMMPVICRFSLTL